MTSVLSKLWKDLRYSQSRKKVLLLIPMYVVIIINIILTLKSEVNLCSVVSTIVPGSYKS